MKAIYKSKLKKWNRDKGCGFVWHEPDKEDIFVHVSEFRHMPRKPVVGDILFYQVNVSEKGKTQAINIGLNKPAPEGRPETKFTQALRKFYKVASFVLLFVGIAFLYRWVTASL